MKPSMYTFRELEICPNLLHKRVKPTKPISSKYFTPSKNNLFRKSNARDNKLSHENSCVKSSSQLQGEHCKRQSDFFPSECPGLCST